MMHLSYLFSSPDKESFSLCDEWGSCIWIELIYDSFISFISNRYQKSFSLCNEWGSCMLLNLFMVGCLCLANKYFIPPR
jgi:hypothetical protein